MSVNSNDDIVDEDDENLLEDREAAESQPFRSVVRSKAREQLDVSIDSPFLSETDRREMLRRRQIETEAASLEDQTAEIKRQLNLVKSRLAKRLNPNTFAQAQMKPLIGASNNNTHNPRAKSGYKNARQAEPKFRPLTGRADCPNCVCDRRSSVCDNCISVAVVRPPRRIDSSNSDVQQTSIKSQPAKGHNDYDDRPIRPAAASSWSSSSSKLDHGDKTVNDVVVPGRVYTISKSLNEKRAKLAQMIDELELLMGRVRKKDSRLNEERKIVNLYKQQWQYGPNIGGPSASARDRLGVNRNRRAYQSKMDANLARDTKSLMAFRHVESDLKLRQYKLQKETTARGQPRVPARSKSLESLKPTPTNDSRIVSRPVNSNFENGKSSSEANLSIGNEKGAKTRLQQEDEDEEEEVEEEEGIEDVIVENSNGDVGERKQEPERSVPRNPSPRTEPNESPKIKKMGWIPVFGETEIKQVKLAPKRKVQIVSPEHGRPTPAARQSRGSIQKLPGSPNRVSSLSTSNRVQENSMREVRRSLNAATNLLQQEQLDSKTKNQLIVKRRSLPTISTVPTIELSKRVQPETSKPPGEQRRASNSSEISQKDETNNPAPKTTERNKEIARLEEKLDEQQRLLEKLAQLRERTVVSPVTVTCSSPCCHARRAPSVIAQPQIVNRPTRHAMSQAKSQILNSNRQMMIDLQRKLEQTKANLARTLEEEFRKQEHLEESVDCSIKKQTNLENESEILKHALSDCIDTCLKDLSSTIESLTLSLGDTSARGFPVAVNRGDDLNKHLRQMKAHIETIERQRRDIFEELSKEKIRSNKMEMELKRNRDDLNKLLEAKQKLESQLNLFDKPADGPNQPEEAMSNCQPSMGSSTRVQFDSNNNANSSSTLTTSQTDTTDRSEYDDSYNSIDLYRRYVQSMSLDTESLRRERKLIFSEFDNIKKMLTDIDK